MRDEAKLRALVVAMARLVLSEQQVAGAKLEHGLVAGVEDALAALEADAPPNVATRVAEIAERMAVYAVSIDGLSSLDERAKEIITGCAEWAARELAGAESRLARVEAMPENEQAQLAYLAAPLCDEHSVMDDDYVWTECQKCVAIGLHAALAEATREEG